MLVDDYKELLHEDFLNFLEEKSILIVGATGMIGAYFAKSILEVKRRYNRKIEVSLMARDREKLNYLFSSYSNEFKYLQHDISHEITDINRYDVFFHASSPASPIFHSQDSEFYNLINANVLGIKNIVEKAKLDDSELIVYLSTSYIYGEEKNENSPAIILPSDEGSHYSISKILAEKILIHESISSSFNYLIIRPFNTYGPGIRMGEGRIIGDLIQSIKSKNKIEFKSPPNHQNSFCYLSDFINAIDFIFSDSYKNCIYNIGNDEEIYSLIEIAELLNQDASTKFKFSFNQDSQRSLQGKPNMIKSKLPDLSKLKSTGWKPRVDLVEGIKRTMDAEI